MDEFLRRAGVRANILIPDRISALSRLCAPARYRSAPSERRSGFARARARRCRARRATASGCAATRRSAASARPRGVRLEHAPALERGEKPRGDLRILRIEREHGVDQEIVAGAVGAVELRLVRHRERADQRAHAIGIGESRTPDAR